MDQGIAALLGAVVGVLGTGGATWLGSLATARQSRRQALRDAVAACLREVETRIMLLDRIYLAAEAGSARAPDLEALRPLLREVDERELEWRIRMSALELIAPEKPPTFDPGGGIAWGFERLMKQHPDGQLPREAIVELMNEGDRVYAGRREFVEYLRNLM
ncbi:hypothetical protein [Streptomyces sp. NPDC058297]|uniref:hypothetical protein n=1 Tax=Streptomyces sp. NPDC058297 TaxID=3346433 RepID=UPI0036E5A27D